MRSEGWEGSPGRCGLQSKTCTDPQLDSRTSSFFPTINSYHLRQCFSKYGTWTTYKRITFKTCISSACPYLLNQNLWSWILESEFLTSALHDVYIHGTFKITKARWPIAFFSFQGFFAPLLLPGPRQGHAVSCSDFLRRRFLSYLDPRPSLHSLEPMELSQCAALLVQKLSDLPQTHVSFSCHLS